MLSKILIRGLLAAALARTAERPAPKPAARPFVKLFTLVGGGNLAEEMTGENVRFIAATYGWINSHGGSWLKPGAQWEYFAGKSGARDARGRTAGDRLRALNPSLILTNYRNGAYISQSAIHEAMEVEKNLPLSIAVHDTQTRLVRGLSAIDTVVVVTPAPSPPPGKPAIYPFKASTTPGPHTVDKQRYVGWVRLDEEILRIADAQAVDGQIRLTVVRGYWNTNPVPHATGTVVLQPVYSGSVRPDGREYYLAGLPDGNSPQRALRYVLMQQRRDFWEFLAAKSQEIFDEGLNGPWYDCAVSSWINHSDAYGVKVEAPYDVDLRRPLDRETYREYQQRKIDFLSKRFPGGELYVNWFFPQFYFDNGHEKYLFSGENGHHPISGGVIETYANYRNMDWLPLMRMQIDMLKSRFRIACWVKISDVGDDTQVESRYWFFAYGTYLLVHEPDAPQYWGAQWAPRPPHGRFTPPAFVYWDLGKPLEHFDDIAMARVPESPGIYRRRYANGIVLVNPDPEKRVDLKLDEEYYDAESAGWTRLAALGPRSARLLLRR